MTRGGGRTLSSNKGFTLAEVLVTLGIIGVVSAMTVPSLMQNHQRKTYVTQLHKVYNEFSQAFLRYQNDKNALDLNEAGLTSLDNIESFMSDYFNLLQNCTPDDTPCISDSYKNINGVALSTCNYWGASCGSPCYSLASGAGICIERLGQHSVTVDGKNIPYGHITIDINGTKGPNIAGRDLFFVTYYPDGSIDEDGIPPICKTNNKCIGGTSAQNVRENYGKNCASSAEAKGCFGLLLNSGWEMNY